MPTTTDYLRDIPILTETPQRVLDSWERRAFDDTPDDIIERIAALEHAVDRLPDVRHHQADELRAHAYRQLTELFELCQALAVRAEYKRRQPRGNRPVTNTQTVLTGATW